MFLFTTLAGLTIRAGYNLNVQTQEIVGVRMSKYLRAQSGFVDAMERLWKNVSPEGGPFSDDGAYTYYLDLDNDTLSLAKRTIDDVKVEISPVDNATTLRQIQSTSIGDW